MRLLLDTHALLWWLDDDRRLVSAARALIEDLAHDVLVSMVTLWEIIVKVRVGKLEFDVAAVPDVVATEGFTALGLTIAHLVALARLPIHHRDPLDRLLIAQAIAEDATFVSEDADVIHYPVTRIACSDLR